MALPNRPKRLIILATLLFLMASVTCLRAQQPAVELFKARVVTTDGHRFRGTLLDVDSSFVYVGDNDVPLVMIRKLVIRRANKKRVQLVGVGLGAIAGGYLAYSGLKNRPPRSAGMYGVTVGFSAIGGSVVGLLGGSAIGNINSRVIRPSGRAKATIYLYREVKPFAQRYQQEMIDHLNNSRQR